MKNKIFKVIVALTVAFSMSFYFSNCTKDELKDAVNGQNEQELVSNETSFAPPPTPGIYIKIVTIKRGDRAGEWPNQWCVGKETLCGLWFQKNSNSNFAKSSTNIGIQPVTDHYSTFNVNPDEKTFVITVDLSEIDEPEVFNAWMEDLNNGYVDLCCDNDIVDTEFLGEFRISNSIMFKKGRYEITNISGSTFDIVLPYEDL